MSGIYYLSPALYFVKWVNRDKVFTNGKGFAVFSGSLDKKKERWIKAIEDDGLNWPSHVSDLNSIISSQHKKTYNAFLIPKNYLIDGNGVIIGKNLFIQIRWVNLCYFIY